MLVDNRYSGDTVDEAQNTALNMIDVLREADGIFASNQTASEGLLLALRQKNLAGKVKFVGFDARRCSSKACARARSTRSSCKTPSTWATRASS